MSYRKRDSKVEEELSKFLDKYLYSAITKDLVRYSDKSDQLLGKDVSFSLENMGNMIVDEKAATHYINKDIPTFAFELSFLLSDGREVKGWLLDKDKVTEYYLLMWVNADKIWDMVMDDITKVEAILLNRNKLIDYLKSESYDEDKLNRANLKIRNNNLDGALGKKQDTSIYFFSTQKLSEKPVNVVVRKKKIEELSDKHYVITKENVEYIK